MANIENNTLSIKEVNDLAKYLYRMLFDEETDIEIKLNNRLKMTLGQFVFFNDGECFIDLSKIVMQQDIHIIADILSHELVHYYLWRHDKPFDDNDADFINITTRKGIVLSNVCVIRAKKLLYQYKQFEYKCDCDGGFKTLGYELNSNNNFRIKIECPHCKKELNANFVGFVDKEYDPTFFIKLSVDGFLGKKKEKEIKTNGTRKRSIATSC